MTKQDMNLTEKLIETAIRTADQMKVQRGELEDLPELYIPTNKIDQFHKDKARIEKGIIELELDLALLKDHIKEDVLEEKETRKHMDVQAVYVGGRVKWNTKGLDKAVVLHPWLEDYKSVGNPFVQIKGL